MANCDLAASCTFYNEHVNEMPHTSEQLRNRYCNGAHTECVRFMIAKKHGMDYVPSYVYPNDIFCALDFDLPDARESLGETPMFIKVVYPDGTAGKEASTTIGNLAKSGEIVAYQLSEGWVELRRKKFIRYSGPDRRHKRAY